MMDTGSRRWPGWVVMLLLSTFYLALRLPRLRELPVFTDEATYLRWAQLVMESPGKYLWVSMEDAKPPLHYWLLALAMPWVKDPVLAGRLLSVGVGLVTIPALFGLSGEMARLRRGGAMDGTWLGMVMALVMICCPYVAFQQRMAIAEGLMLLEMVVIAWLSLRLAREAAEGETTKRCLATAAWLGLAWGAMLLTKQVFSYVCWMLPLAALAAWWGRSKGGVARRFGMGYGMATAMGLAMFVPVLFTNSRHDLYTRVLYKPVFRSTGIFSRWVIAWENLVTLVSPRFDRVAQWWPHDPMRPLQEGWYYVLLTPPLFVVVLVGVLWLLKRREWGVLAFVGMWAAVGLGMLMPGAGYLLPRYLLTGTVPLLLIGAWMLAEVTGRVRGAAPGRKGTAMAGVMLAAVMAWPAWAVAKGVADWRAPVVPQRELKQLISESSGGKASEEAVAWVKARAAESPVTVITGNWIGLPNDLLWLEMSRDPRIVMYWYDYKSSRRLCPAPGPAGMAMLGRERWGDWGLAPTELPAGRRIYMLFPGVRDEETREIRLFMTLADLPMGSRAVAVFTNPPVMPEGAHWSEVVVYEVPSPSGGVVAAK